jgi:hypothetical protein
MGEEHKLGINHGKSLENSLNKRMERRKFRSGKKAELMIERKSRIRKEALLYNGVVFKGRSNDRKDMDNFNKEKTHL